MTCEDLIQWVEDNLPDDFDDYHDIKDWKSDVQKKVLGNSSLLGEDERAGNTIYQVNKYLKGELDVGISKKGTDFDYTTILESIGGHKAKDVAEIDYYDDAKQEYDRIKNDGYPNIDEIELIVESKNMTQADIDALGTKREILEMGGQELLDAVHAKADEIKSTEQEVESRLLRQINKSDSLSDLPSISIIESESVTTYSEERLKSALQSKMDQLRGA